MSKVDAALTAQKSIGTKVRSKLTSYNSLPIERKNYEYVKQLINEAEELRNEFNNNNEFLCRTALLDSEHQYFKANYYDETIKYFTEYKALMQKTIHDLQEANPEQKTGKTGDHVNLDNLFKHANENPKDISNATDTTSTRMGLLMQRLNDYIIAVHKAESENDIDQARTLANIIKSYSRIIEVQCDIISSPSCNIHDFFDMTDEMTRIIAKYEASKPSNPANWQSSAKLPKLNVPLFSGEYVKYKSFKELFQRMIGGQQQLDDCEKLAYLKGQLKGEPLRLLSALPIENASYAIAWETLNDRYENCHLIMVQLMRKLKSGPKMERYVVESMKNITDEISESISLISNMGIPWNEDTDMLFYYIVEERIDSIRSNSDIQLSLSEKVNKRSKRGWVNIFGSALKLTTGVMDHDDSELIQKQVEYLNGTYQNAMKLIADQTTIQDITQNIIKRDEVNVSKQYTLVHNEVLELRNVTIENSHFDSLSIQALSLIENHRERINAIIDVITQVRHGHISTILITPQQLMQHLEKMSGEIKRNLMIPGKDVQTNLVHLYSIMNAEVSMGKRNLIIKLTIPLIEREFYDMHHIIPVPFRNDKNAMRIIHTTAQYICINNRQDKYYMISHNENAACKAFVDNIIICEQKHMLYNIYNGSAECEMAIFTHTTKAISPRCALIPVLGDQIWSKLHTPNTFLFTTKTRTTFNIICGNKATTCYAEGAGIVQLDPQCVLQAANYEITSENDVDYGELHIVIPKLNISDILIEIKPNSSNEPTHETMQLDEQMAILEKAIHNQKQQMQTFPTISVHDIHHYTMVYVIVILLIVFISLFIYWMLKVRKQQSFTIETVPVTNIEKIPKDESLNVTFSA